MAITMNTNVASINAQRNLNKTQGSLMGNFGRLSTGLRINTAADDAAGLAISEKLKSQIRSLSQAERNAYGHFFYRLAHGESGADVDDRIAAFLSELSTHPPGVDALLRDLIARTSSKT